MFTFVYYILRCVTLGLAVAQHRNYLLKKRLSKGPNKIVLSSADFVFPIDVRRVSLQPPSMPGYDLIKKTNHRVAFLCDTVVLRAKM